MLGAFRDFYLRAKSSQLFGLFLVAMLAPIFVQLFARNLYVSVVTTLLGCTMVLSWFWIVGDFLSSLLPSKLRVTGWFFHFAAVYPITYISLLLPLKAAAPIGVVLPLHLFAMFCMGFLLYFVSKNLAMVEADRVVSFQDFAAYLMLLWFFPVGVWVIQPRVNRLYQST